MNLAQHQLRNIVERALDEDAPSGDLTSEMLIPKAAHARAALVAREPGFMAGGAIFEAVFHTIQSSTLVETLVADGACFASGDILAIVDGSIRTILHGERVALNFVQRMCGIATLTSAYVKEVGHSKARIVDTRKTTPGLRILQRYAVRCGGGYNHRFSLSDAVLVKDNHIAAVTLDGTSITDALLGLRKALPHTAHVEVEVDHLQQIEPVLAAGVDTIMLDNFSLSNLEAGVRQVNGRALVEASGGVTLDTVRAIARTGVDLISVGALTHGACSIDLGLDLDVGTEPKTSRQP